MDPLILYLSIRWELLVSFTPWIYFAIQHQKQDVLKLISLREYGNTTDITEGIKINSNFTGQK
jgi:hypothetical protein